MFDHGHVGDAVHFDDGKISGRVVSVNRDVLTVCIDHPRLGAAHWRHRAVGAARVAGQLTRCTPSLLLLPWPFTCVPFRCPTHLSITAVAPV
ncbi:hypothetical protein I552_5448 [Mycobacterium xenopi 3993]|nr:hypothetical protein I552_5448 [Mycobacterium xenopi 3993]